LAVDVEAKHHDIQGLTRAIQQYWAKNG